MNALLDFSMYVVIRILPCLTFFIQLSTNTKQWGEGKFGRLGHGTERNCHSPRLVESLLGKNPVQVACGGFHTAAITEDGKMWTFGGGEHGQLGHGDKVNKVKPTVVQALEGIFVSQITCGWSHSVALTSKGRVYVSIALLSCMCRSCSSFSHNT